MNMFDQVQVVFTWGPPVDRQNNRQTHMTENHLLAGCKMDEAYASVRCDNRNSRYLIDLALQSNGPQRQPQQTQIPESLEMRASMLEYYNLVESKRKN